MASTSHAPEQAELVQPSTEPLPLQRRHTGLTYYAGHGIQGHRVGSIHGSDNASFRVGDNIQNLIQFDVRFRNDQDSANITVNLQDNSSRNFHIPSISQFVKYLSAASKAFEFVLPNIWRPDISFNIERFKAYDYAAEFEYISKTRAPETCIWTRQNPSILSWIENQEPSLLWMTGGPGTGKTVLVTFIVQTLQAQFLDPESKRPFAVLYSLGNGETNNTVSRVLSVALHQLLKQHPDLADEIKSTFSSQLSSNAPLWQLAPDLVWQIFREVIDNSNLKRVYLIIDGLDNCDSGCDLTLLELIRSGPARLSVLLSSQPSERIRFEFSETAGNGFHYQILDLTRQEGPINADIDTVIDREVERLARHRKYSSEQKQRALEFLKGGRSGIFLPITLVLTMLRTTPTRDMENMLKDTAVHLERLDEIYQKLLSAIPEESVLAAAVILRYILYMSRPPLINELSLICEYHANQPATSHHPQSCSEETFAALRNDILLVGPIIKLRHDDNTVEFFHSSAKSFLQNQAFADQPQIRSNIICPRRAHTELAIHCLQQLLLSSEQPYPSFHENNFQAKCNEIFKRYSFLNYSFDSWIFHTRAALSDYLDDGNAHDEWPEMEYTQAKLVRLLETLICVVNDTACQRFSVILALYNRGRSLWQEEPTLLELYCSLGVDRLFRVEFARYKDNLQDEQSTRKFANYVLHCTANRGNFNLFCIAFEALGTYVDLTATCWHSLLAGAASNGDVKLTEFILAKRGVYARELAVAALAAANDDSVLHVLATREHGNATDFYGRNVLHQIAIVATDRGDIQTKTVQRAILAFKQVGVSLNQTDKRQNTILHYICWSNSLCTKPLLQALIGHGADPHLPNITGWRPLHLAARKASFEAFEYLLSVTSGGFPEVKLTLTQAIESDNGASRQPPLSAQNTTSTEVSSNNAPEPKNNTAIQVYIVEIINYASTGGLTPLHWAMSRSYNLNTNDDFQVLRSLLERGFSLVAPTKTGRTPLSIAGENALVIHTLSLVYFRLDGVENMALSTVNTINILYNAKCVDEIWNRLELQRRFQYLIDIERSVATLGESTQAYRRALLVYMIIPPCVLDTIINQLINLEEDFLSKKLDHVDRNFKWDFTDPQIVMFRQWQLIYHLHSTRAERHRPAQFRLRENSVSRARQHHLIQRFLPSSSKQVPSRAGPEMAFKRYEEERVRKTIISLEKNLMLENWCDLLWETFEIFSIKAGQQDIANAALELLPRTKSTLAELGEKHHETSSKLEVLTRLEKTLLLK